VKEEEVSKADQKCDGPKEFFTKQGSAKDVTIEGEKCDGPPEKKLCIDQQLSHAFSGALNNCTINISYH